jgi:cathepsin X
MNNFICLLLFIQGAFGLKSEYVLMPGHTIKEYYLETPPYLQENNLQAIDDLPAEFNWNNMSGESYVTKTLNQHIPQYCGSCWAHGAASALGDRIKIQRKKQNIPGPDINLAIQYILNCGSEIAGSCYGGTATGAYEFIHKSGFIPFDSCQIYIACSSDSDEGFCGHVDTSCSPNNICRTCDTFSSKGGKCSQVDYFPNASISEYGVVRGANNMKIEIYNRGPIACGINANAVLEYDGSYLDVPHKLKIIDHIISVVGWVEKDKVQYWVIRNSWGEYWGNMGYMFLKLGENQLGIESECSWAVPEYWSETNIHCSEDGIC